MAFVLLPATPPMILGGRLHDDKEALRRGKKDW
jgi:hypothetical protein